MPLELELQGHAQVPTWFPTSTDYTFLLSGDPSGSSATSPLLTKLARFTFSSSRFAHDRTSRAGEPHLRHPFCADPAQQPVARPPVLRHQSFPQDVQSAPPAPAQNGSAPSLVSSLQKVHGLSRKKLYGTQPPRQPFVREEPVRTKYKSTPTPLSIQVGSQSPEDTRAVSKTKVERGRRADRLPHIGDMSNSSSPGRRSPWNRISSDVGSSPSSPTTSLSSHHTTSPTIPLYPDLAGYPTSPPSMVSPAPVPDTNFPFHDPSGGYFSMSPPFSSQGPAWTTNPNPMGKSPGTPSAARRHSQELPHGSHMQSLSAMSSKYRLDSASTMPKNTQRVKDAGDVPFIFSPELEAATAAKLHAALQSTTPAPPPSSTARFSGFTSGNSLNYATTEDACASDLFPRLFYFIFISPRMNRVLTRSFFARVTQHAGMIRSLMWTALSLCLAVIDASSRPFGYEDARPTTLANGHVNGAGDGELHLGFVGSTSSSSLQGWAG